MMHFARGAVADFRRCSAGVNAAGGTKKRRRTHSTPLVDRIIES